MATRTCFARFPIAKGFFVGQFASAQIHLLYVLLYTKFNRLESCAVVAVITEWLVQALPATAPAIHFIMNFWIRHCVGSHLRATGLHFSLDLVRLFQLFLCILEVLDIEVDCFVLEGHVGIGWLDDPVLSGDGLELAYEAFLYGNQGPHAIKYLI